MSSPEGEGGARAGEPAAQAAGDARRWAWPTLAAILAAGLALRLWGARQGLPYVFNTDEADHFLPHAVKMFQRGTLNPHYFANPPAFTYLLHFLLAIAYGGGRGAIRAFALEPAEVYTLARVAAAVLGAAALWLLYATGARLFDRAVGLLAAAIEAVAFLPVFYAHLALNDVPTLAPLTLSLLGSAGVLRRGRARDYLLAGAGLGLACASKYTAGIAVLPLAAAAAVRYLDRGSARPARSAAALGLAAAAALAAFLIANPYAVLDYSAFHEGLLHQSKLSAEGQGKLGAPRQGGLVYYLWSLTWGLGWVPSLAALGGAVALWRGRPALGSMLVPAPLLFLAFMGLQGRYFGRWLLPIFPLLCLLAAFFAVWLIRSAAARLRRAEGHRGARALSVALAGLIVLALLAQGLLYSVHSGLVLARADTRNLTRAWMLAHVPRGARVVVEPVSPEAWARETRPGTSTAANPRQWNKYPSLLARISPAGRLEDRTTQVSIENYERTLAPALIGYYERHGYCWVVSGSTQSGRAFADPSAVPQAVAYYRALARQAQVVFRASPYSRGQRPVAFNFDWSFDYYPLAYTRPGPQMTIYRLHGGRCT
ncbi:MAG TPA: glycosyltransferase family 39 protein [Solirubrobacteraceae bacterium]|nr:glycosyltransferase family 39 protein [Solirubrobacteraceae bacterium]